MDALDVVLNKVENCCYRRIDRNEITRDITYLCDSQFCQFNVERDVKLFQGSFRKICKYV